MTAIMDFNHCYLLVDLQDVESMVALKVVSGWAQRVAVPVSVQPFLKPKINTAGDVPKGSDAFEAYKNKRAAARNLVRAQERLRDLQRLGLTEVDRLSPLQWLQIHWGLLQVAEQSANLSMLFDKLFAVLRAADGRQRGDALEILLAFLVSDSEPSVAFEMDKAHRDLHSVASAWQAKGVLSAPSLWLNGEVFMGVGHLPLITDRLLKLGLDK